MHERVQSLNSILKRVRLLNQEDSVIALSYRNDNKFARVQKRLKERQKQDEEKGDPYGKFSWTRDMKLLNAVLLAVKDSADESFLNNTRLVENPDYFAQLIVGIIATQFRQAEINSDKATRHYIGDLINKEYQNEYMS